MRPILPATLGVVLLTAAWAITAHAVKPEETPETIAKGKAIFNNVCVFCHGVEGEGDGPAAFFIATYSAPRPRNFVEGKFKFRSTAYGELPTDEDLFRTVTNGVAGFMPSFEGLSEEERWQVIAYVKTFHPAFQQAAREPLRLDFPRVKASPASIEQGRALFGKHACTLCHGPNGRGKGDVFKQEGLKGQDDLPVQPRDLSNRVSYKNGGKPGDIFRTIMAGLRQMPGYADQFKGREEDAWHLVNYVLSLSRQPRPHE